MVHLGTHDGVARAVPNGQVPAGVLSEPICRALIARKANDEAKFRQFDLSDPYRIIPSPCKPIWLRL